MSWKRIWAIFKARNHEFFRDKAAFGWNFLFPFLIIAGFGILFSDADLTEYKVGLVAPESTIQGDALPVKPPPVLNNSRYLRFIPFDDHQTALRRLKHHKIDMLIETESRPLRYWISDTSPRGYLAEKLLQAALQPVEDRQLLVKEEIQGLPIRYIDWLFPGILAMNMMFSALWGVGYVVVRYRKNGVLKRLKATPLTAFEYLSAQMLSRIFLLMFTLLVVWVGCDLVFDFQVEGSYALLALIFFCGSLSLTSLGLILASRGVSEEFTTGILNFISWPMMFLSEVWFSLEGSPQWVQQLALIFPLTHILKAARRVMSDGGGIIAVQSELLILSAMTMLFLSIGAYLFSWNE